MKNHYYECNEDNVLYECNEDNVPSWMKYEIDLDDIIVGVMLLIGLLIIILAVVFEIRVHIFYFKNKCG